MERGMNKAVIVTRKTRLTLLVERYNTVEQARFYIEHMGEDFTDYVTEDRNYREAVMAVAEAASRFARVQTVDRSFVPSMVFGRDDAVIAVGQDGMVANVMKYLGGQPLLGVNPDPARWDGVLLPFEAGEIAQLLPKVFSGCYNKKNITMAEALTRDGQRMLAVNDFFIGIKSHASARYRIRFGKQQENQSSSGIIVSTGLGSTGWYRSILAEADGIARLFGGGAVSYAPIPWDADDLTFLVREPFPSRSTQAALVCGKIGRNRELTVTSAMPEGGVIFSDGMEEDALSFCSGNEVRIRPAAESAHLVVR